MVVYERSVMTVDEAIAFFTERLEAAERGISDTTPLCRAQMRLFLEALREMEGETGGDREVNTEDFHRWSDIVDKFIHSRNGNGSDNNSGVDWAELYVGLNRLESDAHKTGVVMEPESLFDGVVVASLSENDVTKTVDWAGLVAELDLVEAEVQQKSSDDSVDHQKLENISSEIGKIKNVIVAARPSKTEE